MNIYAVLPKISVVLAVYNGGTLLDQTIRSLLNQTLANFELIIVDGGSTDGTQDRIRAYRDPRIRFIELTERVNQSAGLHIGIQESSGDWVARIDADDPAHPQRLELAQRFLSTAAERFGVVSSEMKIIHDDEEATWRTYEGKLPPIQDVTRWLAFFNPIGHSAAFIRKKAYDESGGFSPPLDRVNDYWLWGKLAKLGWRLGKIPLVLQAKRIHPNQQFENKQRRTYVAASVEAQKWIVKNVFGWPSWVGSSLGAARTMYGRLPAKIRIKVREVAQSKDPAS